MVVGHPVFIYSGFSLKLGIRVRVIASNVDISYVVVLVIIVYFSIVPAILFLELICYVLALVQSTVISVIPNVRSVFSEVLDSICCSVL